MVYMYIVKKCILISNSLADAPSVLNEHPARVKEKPQGKRKLKTCAEVGIHEVSAIGYSGGKQLSVL